MREKEREKIADFIIDNGSRSIKQGKKAVDTNWVSQFFKERSSSMFPPVSVRPNLLTSRGEQSIYSKYTSPNLQLKRSI